jgi:HemY protein
LIEPEPSAVAPTETAPEEKHDSKYTPPVPAAEASTAPSRRPGTSTQPKPEPVIPLVHAPDDPGPDAVEESDAPVEPQSGGWRKLFE